MARSVLVTGGAGFIGSNLVEYMSVQEPSWKIRVIDDLSTGTTSNLEGLPCELIIGSILDNDLLSDIATGVDNIVHLAAIGSVPRSISAPRPTNDANITGTLNVLEVARQQNVGHVVVASSSSVYGSNPKIPREENDWTRPLSPYAVSKLATEAYAIAFSHSYDLRTLALRLFNVYGPRQRADHPYAAVVPTFISSGLKNEPLTVRGDGFQTRDFTYVETVCQAIFTACEASLSSEKPVNLAFGKRHSILELIRVIEELLGTNLDVRFDVARPGDVLHSTADNIAFRALFPAVSEVALSRGLQATVEWFENEMAQSE